MKNCIDGLKSRGVVAGLGALLLFAGVGLLAAPNASAAGGAVGFVDAWSVPRNGQVRVAGWALDTRLPRMAISTAFVVDVTTVWQGATVNTRPDVNAAFATTGGHGFDITFALGKGPHRVCMYAVDAIGARASLTNGCYTLTVR